MKRIRDLLIDREVYGFGGTEFTRLTWLTIIAIVVVGVVVVATTPRRPQTYENNYVIDEVNVR